MTLEGYATFRSASFRSSSVAYADLEALQEQHLKQRWRRQERSEEEEEAHQQELADLAMNGYFVSNLLQEVRGELSNPPVEGLHNAYCIALNRLTVVAYLLLFFGRGGGEGGGGVVESLWMKGPRHSTRPACIEVCLSLEKVIGVYCVVCVNSRVIAMTKNAGISSPFCWCGVARGTSRA